MSSFLLHLLLCSLLSEILNSQMYVPCQHAACQEWIKTSSPRLPRSDEGAAIGHIGDTAFIIGGIKYPNQITRWDTLTRKYTSYGSKALPTAIYGSSQYYTQVNHTLYMIDPIGINLNIYDLSTNQFTPAWLGLVIPTTVGSQSCIASTQRYLYIVGGRSPPTENKALTKMHRLDLQRYQWNYDPLPEMTHSRRKLACIAVESTQTLYAIAGQDDTVSRDSVEYINLNNIE